MSARFISPMLLVSALDVRPRVLAHRDLVLALLLEQSLVGRVVDGRAAAVHETAAKVIVRACAGLASRELFEEGQHAKRIVSFVQEREHAPVAQVKLLARFIRTLLEDAPGYAADYDRAVALACDHRLGVDPAHDGLVRSYLSTMRGRS